MRPQRAAGDRLLQRDVAAMITETGRFLEHESDELARDIIVVVRERVLKEIESYAREQIR